MTVRRIALLVSLFAATLSACFAHAQTDDPDGLLNFLTQSISWYRHVQVPGQLSIDPSDSIYSSYNRNSSIQTVSLIFDFARAQGQQIQIDHAAQTPENKPANGHDLTQLVTNAQQRVTQATSDLDTLQQQASQLTGKKRLTLDDQIAEQKSELELARARLEALQNMAAFASAGTSAGVLGKINELERTVPEVRSVARPVEHTTHPQHSDSAHTDNKETASATSNPSAPTTGKTESTSTDSDSNSSSSAPAATITPFAPLPAAAASTATPVKQPNNSILSLAGELFSLTSKINAQRDAINATVQLRASLVRILDPLKQQMRTVNQRGEELSSQPQTTDPAVLTDRKKQIDNLTTDYKRLSSALLPLAKASILLDATSNNLAEWRSETERTYSTQARALLLRVGIVIVAIIAVMVGSDFWRRAIFRYVKDQRRRNQYLLLRRIVVAVVIVLILIFALSTEIGSLATFAGFLTAGIAVALQNVILSVAAYFFLIGRYGIRVGDRIQIGEVTGDVVDIGLVRLHLVELDVASGEARPTGRIVVFSNSVVFQPSSNFFKQLPGSDFAWRKISLTLSSDVDYGLAEQRISAAVAGVYNTYKPELDRQHRTLESSLAIQIDSTEPQTRLRLEATGLEIVILYPVVLTQASEIDDRMTHALLDSIETEPRLRLVGGGLTSIKPVDATPHPAPIPVKN
jgi:small-conductance mechanosensitive channel